MVFLLNDYFSDSTMPQKKHHEKFENEPMRDTSKTVVRLGVFHPEKGYYHIPITYLLYFSNKIDICTAYVARNIQFGDHYT